MKLPRRQFLHLAAGAAALPVVISITPVPRNAARRADEVIEWQGWNEGAQ